MAYGTTPIKYVANINSSALPADTDPGGLLG
jgi:hypothetical protein